MKKLLIIAALVLLLMGSGVFIFLKVRGGETKAKAVLKVTSTPAATIFLDNQNIGKTPFEDKVDPGEFTLKLIPESTVDTVVSWEGRIKLSPNLLTYINRDLGDSDLTTSGEMLLLEKISGGKSKIAIISTPDAAKVKLSGVEKGTTPVVLENLDPGNYELSVFSSGFKERMVKVKTTAGFKLTAEFQLAVSSEKNASSSPVVSPMPETTPKSTPKTSPRTSAKTSPEASTSATPRPKATPPAKPYVEILDTPTGFLRVRKDPGTSGEEIGRVNPGEMYSLLDEQTASGTPWYKIEYEKGREGWITSQYAKKVE